MPSVLPGFEYDIFISYRQKDNKGDRWVSEFISALKTELEATFKEDISIFFDENPHDGLLETHDVGASLKDKLRCLIFIPIISQTYCDTKSFAWQHEFIVFNKMASKDRFGRDIKLANGNVASRILPVKIHDIDSEDKKNYESETGSVLRCIEFIFKQPGVNRPLKTDDNRKDNINGTIYRDQINKIADSIWSGWSRACVDLFKGKLREALELIIKTRDHLASGEPFAGWWLAQIAAYAGEEEAAYAEFTAVASLNISPWIIV